MQTKDTLSAELTGLDFKHIKELERNVIEGTYHTGKGSVVQLIAVKSA